MAQVCGLSQALHGIQGLLAVLGELQLRVEGVPNDAAFVHDIGDAPRQSAEEAALDPEQLPHLRRMRITLEQLREYERFPQLRRMTTRVSVCASVSTPGVFSARRSKPDTGT